MFLLFPPQRPHFDAALRDVNAKDPRARTLAAEALGNPPTGRADDAKRALRTLMDDGIAGVRAAAISSLGRLKDAGALETILARFEDGDDTVRQVAIIAAGEIGDRRAIEPIERAIEDQRPEIRFQAVASLAAIAGEEAVPKLAPLTGDPDPEVRAHLADALGSLEVESAAAPLARLLDDAVPAVRYGAAMGLARAGDDRGVELLIGALGHRDRGFEAAWALGELRAEDAREPLARVALSFLKPLAIKAAAAAALVRLDDPRGAFALRGVLTAFRSDARSYAAQLVGELRLAELADDVADLVRRPRGADLAVVAEALGKLAPVSERARIALEDLARRDDDVGAAARAAKRD